MSKNNRNSARHRVKLSVRFGVASEFVQEYAENLSQGGLFVAGAQHLAPLSTATVELELPGAGTFKLTCEVAHVLTPDIAERMGRSPGAGMAIRRAPKGFMEAVQSYLQRLGRRADATVIVLDDAHRTMIHDAGYQTVAAPPADQLAAAIVHLDATVVAVVVPRSREQAYLHAAAAAGAGDIVIRMDSAAELGDVLRRIDDEL